MVQALCPVEPDGSYHRYSYIKYVPKNNFSSRYFKYGRNSFFNKKLKAKLFLFVNLGNC